LDSIKVMWWIHFMDIVMYYEVGNKLLRYSYLIKSWKKKMCYKLVIIKIILKKVKNQNDMMSINHMRKSDNSLIMTIFYSYQCHISIIINSITSLLMSFKIQIFYSLHYSKR